MVHPRKLLHLFQLGPEVAQECCLLVVFSCAALSVLGEFVEDSETGLQTGTITANGQTYTIEPHATHVGDDLLVGLPRLAVTVC